jgi:hypothetical protein
MPAKVWAPPEGYEEPRFDDFMGSETHRFDNEGYFKACDEHQERLAQWCRENSDSDIAGETIDFPIADGRAVYMVLSTRPLELIHLSYGDGYQIDEMMLRGMRVSDVRRLVAQRKALEKLFGGKG